jgi:hypothetical protein
MIKNDSSIDYMENCSVHENMKLTIYCICGKALCIKCFEFQIHIHENVSFINENHLNYILTREIAIISQLISEIEIKQNLKDDLINFKEIQRDFYSLTTATNEKKINFLNSNYKNKLKSIIINSMKQTSYQENKRLESLINKVIKNEKLKIKKKTEMKKLKRRQKKENIIITISPSPVKNKIMNSAQAPLSENKVSSIYGSAYVIKQSRHDFQISNFVDELFDSNPPSAAKEDLETPINQDVTSFENLFSDKNGIRSLATCFNCNMQFLSKLNCYGDFCTKCKKGEEKVTLVCQCCRDNFKVTIDDAEIRSKCDICFINSLKN